MRLLWCAVAAALLGTTGAPADAPVPRFERGGAFPLDLSGAQRIDTGVLVVREDRSRPDGRLIRLPVAILRSSAPSPAPDPVLYLAGGPGGSALNTARYGSAYPFLAHRDFVIVEPRGARYADPALLCPDVPAARVDDAIRPGADVRADAEVVAARTCQAQTTAAGIDPSAYTTAASAADLDDLRRVLGYAQWNLYGVSYGTRLGLAILRQFPGTVRSAVLDSVLPPTVRYDDASRDSRTRSLDLLLGDCEADLRCQAAYPDLRRRWRRTIEAATVQPMRVVASAGSDAPAREVVLTADALAAIIPLDDTDTLPELPRLLSGIADGELTARARLGQWALRPSSYAWGLRYSVWCAEETPFARSARAPTARLVVQPGVCDAWHVRPVTAETRRAVVSDVPVLLLSGEYDPETPPTWAAEAARTLSRSQAVTLRGMGHAPSQTWSMPCAMTLADAFIRQPTATVDRSCALTLGAPPFKTARYVPVSG